MTGMEPFLIAAGMSAATAGSVATAASVASTVAAVAGAGLTAYGTIYQGQAGADAAKFQAKQLQTKADQEMAIASRAADQKRREGALLTSRARAAAAGSGGGTDNATVTNILTGIQNEGEYNALIEMYNGTQRRDTLLGQARSGIMGAKSGVTASYLSAAGTVADTGGTLFRRYANDSDYYGASRRPAVADPNYR